MNEALKQEIKSLKHWLAEIDKWVEDATTAVRHCVVCDPDHMAKYLPRYAEDLSRAVARKNSVTEQLQLLEKLAEYEKQGN